MMKAFTRLCWIVACLAVAGSVAIGKKRNSNEKTRDIEKRSKNQLCSTLIVQCKRNQACRETLKVLKLKCAVKHRKCNAGMRDLQGCAHVMDVIMESYFQPKERCVCDKGKESRCSRIYDIIYENPCFASVKFLREKEMMPRIEENSTTSLNDPEQESTTPSTRGLIDELMELILSDSDDNVVTFAVTDKQSSEDFDGADSTLEKEADSPANNVLNGNILSDPEESSDNGSLLLYIILAVVGILIVTLLFSGGVLLFYFGLFRPAQKTKKSALTK